jgi:Holliday junction resolvase RusA-like endonuclease
VDSKTATFWIPGKFPSLNEYVEAERTHRMAGAAMKKKWTTLVAKEVTKLNIPTFSKPVYVSFEWHELNKKRDPDNFTWNHKSVFDGLVTAGVLKNDSQKEIVGFDDTWLVDESRRAGVMVSIVEYE